jgi:Xaa-Pro aminopeptidase
MRSASLEITPIEYQQRVKNLLSHLQELGWTGLVLFDNNFILYYTGFAFIPTERPVAFILNNEGTRSLLVPRLEYEHAVANAQIDQVEAYIEYPYDLHPLEILKNVLERLGIQRPYGADNDGYPSVWGYRGPSLSQLMSSQPEAVRDFIEDQMMLKSSAELALIRESVKWGHLAHRLLQRYTAPGVTETDASSRASREATLAMLDAIGPIYRAQNPYLEGAQAGYRGQIGRNAAIPHALANNLPFQQGDVLVSGSNAPVWGYNSELERTMILGRPSEAQKRFFNHMLALQEIAFNAMKPGVSCSEVDRAVRKYYDEHDLIKYWKHHSGHSIGLREHEAPFLDIGDHTILQPGMVFTVEPGLYVPDIGGFRHSDTVVITDDGIDILTYYPRDLLNLTLPV